MENLPVDLNDKRKNVVLADYALVGKFVPFSMMRIRLMTRVELHKHPNYSRMRPPQNFFAQLLYL